MALVRLLRFCVGAFVVGALSVAFTVSFAALIYNGDLAHLLGGGLSFTLLGAGLMALIGGFALSTRGIVVHQQDVTALLIGGAAAGLMADLADPEQALGTIVLLIFLASLFAGVAIFVVGRFRWGSLVRHIPYPVLAGFLAANGYLLFMGGLSIATGASVSTRTIFDVLSSEYYLLWLPWVLSGAALIFLERRIKNDLTLPSFLVSATAVFYAACWMTGTSLEEARDLGFLLGPFSEGRFVDGFKPGIVTAADFSVLPGQIPFLFAVAGLAVLGALLNSSGLELSRDQESDTDADMRATGVANLVSAGFGGMPGYTAMSTTIVAGRLGLQFFWPGLVAATALLSTFYFGTKMMSYVPAGLLALIVVYIGLDLFLKWFWQTRHQFTRPEYGVVVLIVAVAALAGFLPALGVGTLAAAAIFVTVYSQTSVVRVETNARHRRSRVERSDAADQVLQNRGAQTAILELSGYIFFGTGSRLVTRANAILERDAPPRTLLLDFTRVTGIDASAASSLIKISRAAAATGTHTIFTGLKDDSWRQIQRLASARIPLTHLPTLDTALEQIEEQTLARCDVEDEEQGMKLIAAVYALEEACGDDPMAVRRATLAEGDTLVAEGEASDEIYILLSGGLRAEVKTADGKKRRIARIRPFTMVGEIAHYAGVNRTAALVADAPSELIRIDLKAIGDRAKAERADFHAAAARTLARRVTRMNALIRDADI